MPGFPVGTGPLSLDGRRIEVPPSAALMSLKCWDFKWREPAIMFLFLSPVFHHLCCIYIGTLRFSLSFIFFSVFVFESPLLEIDLDMLE